MVLPSQTARPALRGRRAGATRRPRRKRGAVLLGAVAVLLTALLGMWLILRPGEAEQPPRGAGPVASRTPVPLPAADVAIAPGQKQAQAAPPPVVPAVSKPAPPRPEPPEPPRSQAAAADSQPAAARPELRPWQPPAGAPAASARRADDRVAAGLRLADSNKPVEARRELSAALDSGLASSEAAFVRETLAVLNRRLVFGPEVAPGDPFCRYAAVQPGALLVELVRAEKLQVDWRFILRINGIPSAGALRAGARIKLVTGPFHAVVTKSDYRMDLYLGSAEPVYVASFPVGLGEYNSTPVGRFRVRPQSKLIDPAWSNPRTGQRFDPSDPSNPIGDRWIGLQGIDEATQDLAGYGIHGTIEPDSIGRQASMGCIRMLPQDVEIVYEMLVEGVSVVEIR